MARITAFLTSAGFPMTAPATTPTIRIRRADTNALIVTDQDLTHIGEGAWKYEFTEDPDLEYSAVIDSDPLAVAPEFVQVEPGERYHHSAVGSPGNDVWGHDITAATTGVDHSTAGKALNSSRQSLFNTLRPATVGVAGTLVLLEDDGINVKATFILADVDNNIVVGVAGQPGNRAAGT